MSSGMNTKQAKEYAKTMTYSEAVSNIRYGKGIKYRKATMIKLRELAEIADRLDRKTKPREHFIVVKDGKPTVMYRQIKPQKIYCPKCGRSDYIKDLEKDFGVKVNTFKYKCINCNTYIKDKLQTESDKE